MKKNLHVSQLTMLLIVEFCNMKNTIYQCRYRLNFWYKLANGLSVVSYHLSVSAMMIVIFGVLIWLAEQRVNEEFNKKPQGAITGKDLGEVLSI